MSDFFYFFLNDDSCWAASSLFLFSPSLRPQSSLKWPPHWLCWLKVKPRTFEGCVERLKFSLAAHKIKTMADNSYSLQFPAVQQRLLTKGKVNCILFVSLSCHWRDWNSEFVHLLPGCRVWLLMKSSISVMLVSRHFIGGNGLWLSMNTDKSSLYLASGQQCFGPLALLSWKSEVRGIVMT